MQHCTEPDSIAAIEAQALERYWFEGKLQPLVERLLLYVALHRTEILALAGEHPSPAAIGQATQRLIEDERTVDHEAEMSDQIKEIHKEIWYHGERGDHDVERIKQEWVKLHAANWRRWLLKEYLFLTERCAHDIAAALAIEPASPAGTGGVTAKVDRRAAGSS